MTAASPRPRAHLTEPYRGPIPAPEPETAFYWEGLTAHELRILRCRRCRRYVHYPLAVCPSCHCFELAPERVSGDGTLYSYTDVHVRFVDGIEPPYVVGLVELAEQPGLRLLSNLVDVDVERIRIGMPLRAVFSDVTPQTTLLHFTARDDDE